MKLFKIILLFIFVTPCLAQNDSLITTISLVKVDKVYRGITNQIKIAVPNTKTFTATAPGILKKIDSLGNYHWNVTSVPDETATIKIDMVLADGLKKHEEIVFKIAEIAASQAILKSDFQDIIYTMTREQLANIKLEVVIRDFYFEIDDNRFVESYEMTIPDEPTYIIHNENIPDELKNKIYSLQTNSEILISHIRQNNPHGYCLLGSLGSIKIIIKDAPKPLDFVPDLIVSQPKSKSVYRGISNALKINVPDVKSFKITGDGNLIRTGYNSYNWNVTGVSADRAYLDFEIIMPNDSVIQDRYHFYVKDIPEPITQINGYGCKKCLVEMNLKELEEAKLTIDFQQVDLDIIRMTYIRRFEVVFPDESKSEVEGYNFDKKILKKIKALPSGSIITINILEYRIPGVCGYLVNMPGPVRVLLIN
ncbi:hypothetical protein [Flavobacterium rhizosphaerae]|uniref:Gliding motility-associated protein GldM C-terminal domain-containing protein n=1 Tax=Flavobacterium rhizosphaerae TaxID=3163298 RepID=A0ABW8YW22_9FLAO